MRPTVLGPRFWLPALVIGAVAALTLSSRIGTTDFHGDESGWISAAYYYTDLVRTGDLTRARWDCKACSEWGSLNPHLAKWLIGFPLVADRTLEGRGFSAYYRFDQSREANAAAGRLPPADMLARGRRAVAVVGVLCALLVFAIGYGASGPLVGVVAAALLLVNPVFLTHATRVMTDAHYNAFLLTLVVALVVFERAERRRGGASTLQHPWRFASLSGLVVGLAASVKVSAVIIGGAAFAVVAGVMLPRRAWLRNAGAFGVSAIVVLYALNPTWWIAPSDLSPRPLADEVARLSGRVRAGTFVAESAEEQFPRLYRLGMFPLTFVRWQRLMSNQLLSNTWEGNRMVTIHKRLFGNYAGVSCEWIFLVIGLAVLVGSAIQRTPPDPPRVSPLAILVYFVVNYLFVVGLLRLDWDRYYLPVLIAGHLVTAVGVVACVSTAWVAVQRLARRGLSGPDPAV